MIQRPQTLFFLALIAISVMLIFSNIVFFNAEDDKASQKINVEYDETITLNSGEESSNINTLLISVAAGLAMLSLAAMLLFKNRKMQILLASVNYLLILLFIMTMYYYSMNQVAVKNKQNQSFTYAALLPMALLFFNFLAIRGVKKDEQLVRSMDRLR